MRSVESVTSDGWQEYRFGPGWAVTQLWPTTCKNGHPFRPGTGTTGWSVPHIVYHCSHCHDTGLPNSTTYWTPRPVEWLIARALAQAIADGLVDPSFRLAAYPGISPVRHQ